MTEIPEIFIQKKQMLNQLNISPARKMNWKLPSITALCQTVWLVGSQVRHQPMGSVNPEVNPNPNGGQTSQSPPETEKQTD